MDSAASTRKETKNTTRKNIKFASFCKMLHPINVKTLKRLPDDLTGFSSFNNISAFHSLFRWESFFSLLAFKCRGEEIEGNTLIAFALGIYCIVVSEKSHKILRTLISDFWSPLKLAWSHKFALKTLHHHSAPSNTIWLHPPTLLHKELYCDYNSRVSWSL